MSAENKIPVCLYCGRVKNGDDQWVNATLSVYEEARIEHVLCDDCKKKNGYGKKKLGFFSRLNALFRWF